MPKLKVEDEELDIEELEDAEYSDAEFDDYDGDIPPKGTVLMGYVKKLWWTYTKNEDPMLVALFIAAENGGDEEEFNGLPIWERMALTANAKFKWKPFIDAIGVTLLDIKKKTIIDGTDDNIGAPITKINKWEPGGDESWVRVVTGKEKYNDEWQAKVAKWLDFEDEEDDEEDEEPEPEPQPTKKPRAAAKKAEPEPEPDDEDDEDDDQDEEDEPEEDQDEEPEPPAKARRATARPAAKPAARGQRTAASATSAKPAAKGTPPRRRSSKGSDEAPF